MVTRDEVLWAFRYCLGREPESEEAIAAHLHHADWKALRAVFFSCDEYRCSALINGALGVAGDRASKWVLAPVMGGTRHLWLDLGDRFVSRGCLWDNYEPIESAFVRRHLNKDSVFVDIGANIGWFTILASTLIGKAGAIIAFEPRPQTAAHLLETIEANGLQDMITLHQCGLSDEGGSAFINSFVNTDNPGNSFVSSAPVGPEVKSYPITLKTLDYFKLASVDFLKMDVEGSEMMVAKGGIQTISRCRPIIMSEICPQALRDVSGVTPNDFLRLFLDLHYEISIIDTVHGGQIITSYPEYWTRDLMNVAIIPKS